MKRFHAIGIGDLYLAIVILPTDGAKQSTLKKSIRDSARLRLRAKANVNGRSLALNQAEMILHRQPMTPQEDGTLRRRISLRYGVRASVTTE